MTGTSDISVRPASIEDTDFIISLIPRLIEFTPPIWRDAKRMIEIDKEILINKLRSQPEGTVIFIAEEASGTPLGFIHLQPGSDYYNHEKHGHISDVIVASEAIGRGIGKKLIAYAEQWAREQGYRWLTLSVFAQNTHAREVYDRLGFGEDIIKYVKEIS